MKAEPLAEIAAWRPAVSPVSVTHFLFALAIAAYLCWFYPPSQPSVLTMLAVFVAAELVPPILRRFLAGEILVIAGAALVYAQMIADHQAAFAGWSRMALLCWLLCPSRPGALRWVSSLVIGELILIGKGDGSFHNVAVLVPLALCSLAADSWLQGAFPARVVRTRPGTGRRPAIALALPWLIVPLMAITGLALLGGAKLDDYAASYKRRHGMALSSGHTSGFAPTLRIGDHHWIDKDPNIVAQLLFDESWSGAWNASQTVYLRAMTLPVLVIDGPNVAWTSEQDVPWLDASSAFDGSKPWSWVVRQAGGGDVVLRPDGGGDVELPNLACDRDDNLFSDRLGDELRIYRVQNPDGDLAPQRNNPRGYRAVPRPLNALPWHEIEDPTWRLEKPEAAAAAICDLLQGRCTYDINNLPSPAAGSAGTLRTFLFGRPDQRRGHCQYFASAATVLLRRAGHSARCVAGFASNEHDEQGFTFRGFHAHAWIEVLSSAGAWQRFDPTPASRLTMRDAGDSATELAQPKPVQLPDPEATMVERKDKGHAAWYLAAIPVLAALAFALLRRRPASGDARQTALSRQANDLYRLAASLGVSVERHTTLSCVAGKLGELARMDLSPLLDAHLAARFSNGPMPKAWPLDEIRERARLYAKP